MPGKEKYINPFTDFGFKKLFGAESSKVLLIDFLNQVVGNREQIRNLAYLNTENLGKTEADRKAMFDLYCENQDGEKFIIELQNAPQAFFKDRSIFYATFPVSQQAPKGNKWDYCLKAVYTIGILNFRLRDKAGVGSRYFREVQLLDKQTFEVFYEKLTFIYLEMSRFKKPVSQLVTHFDKWLYALKNLHKLRAQPAQLQEAIFDKLFSEAEIAKLNPEEMKTYQESLKVYRDNHNAMEYMLQQGEEKGLKKGIKQGRLETAKGLKRINLPIEQIIEVTKLTKEEIEKL